MKRLMEQLSGGSKVPQEYPSDLRKALTKAVQRCRTRDPVPTVELDDVSMQVRADMERLTTVFEHLIRNAQDATDAGGEIAVEARTANRVVKVSIKDTGKGMSPDFIRERLFRPFDSTKGSQNMGIGAYQARDYVRTLGGQLEVSSVIGGGTTFMIRLPVDD